MEIDLFAIKILVFYLYQMHIIFSYCYLVGVPFLIVHLRNWGITFYILSYYEALGKCQVLFLFSLLHVMNGSFKLSIAAIWTYIYHCCVSVFYCIVICSSLKYLITQKTKNHKHHIIGEYTGCIFNIILFYEHFI